LNNSIKTLSGDPGKLRDAFFIVGTEIINDKLYVRLAIQRHGRAYKQVCQEFADIQTEQITRITTLSNCVAGKLRCKITVVEGKSKDSVFVIKHGKQE